LADYDSPSVGNSNWKTQSKMPHQDIGKIAYILHDDSIGFQNTNDYNIGFLLLADL